MSLPITLAILTWNAPETLENTLWSYQKSGILDNVEQKLIFIQANGEKERAIDSAYGFTILSSEQNIGIQAAYQQLLAQATAEHFLFCENDWFCIENALTTITRLSTAIDLIKNHAVKCVRLRHKYQYGLPLHTLQFIGDELKQPSHFLDCIHWIEDPSLQYPDYATKLTLNGENWFLAKAQNANFTNNPCLYNTDWLRNLMRQDYSEFSSEANRKTIEHYAKKKRINPKFVMLEACIQTWWSTQDFLVAQGVGLFQHNPLIRMQKSYNLLVAIGQQKNLDNQLNINRLPHKNWHPCSDKTAFADLVADYAKQTSLKSDIKYAKSVLFIYEAAQKEYQLADLQSFIQRMESLYPGKKSICFILSITPKPKHLSITLSIKKSLL